MGLSRRYVFRDGVGRLCCWLEGVPILGPVQEIVVPAIALHRCCFRNRNRNPPQCPLGELCLSSGHLEPSRLSWAPLCLQCPAVHW